MQREPIREFEFDSDSIAESNLLLAVERTMLAWIRTGIAMIGFGFVVARFGLFLRSMTPASPQSHGVSLYFGAALTLAGGLATGYGALLYRRRLAAMERGEPLHPHDTMDAARLGYALAFVGVALAIYLAVT